MAAGHSVDPLRWLTGLDELLGSAAGRFGRVEPRLRVRSFVLGLLAGLPRVNCWTIAEHAGESGPQGMQRLLSAAVWDHDGLLEDVRAWTVQHLGDEQGILVVDETGDVKKGSHTVGVQRQYTGTAGRIENAQVAVYLTYSTARGHALMDRGLYLPKSWTENSERRAEAGVPKDRTFATKPALAQDLIEKAVAAGVSASWVAGDEVYGTDSKLRTALQKAGLGYVLAVAKDHQIRTGIGLRRAIDLAVRLPATFWQRLSAGAGAHGQRWYDWALVETSDEKTTSEEKPGPSGEHWLLIRRHRSSGEYAFYRAWSPQSVPLRTLVMVAGRRWTIEESFASSKELAGLDEHQVRTWTSWHRWSALAILAHAFLSVTTAAETPAPSLPSARDTSLIPLTRNEIRRLLNAATRVLHSARHVLHWSRWRRGHQARARTGHYAANAILDVSNEVSLQY